MAPLDYTPSLSYAAAALGVYIVADILVCKGCIHGGDAIHGGLMGLVALLGQRSTVLMVRWWGRGEAPAGVEYASGALEHEANHWLPVVAAWVIGVVLGAGVKAVREGRRRAPGRRGRAGRRA